MQIYKYEGGDPGPPSSSPTLLRLHHDQEPLLCQRLPKG